MKEVPLTRGFSAFVDDDVFQEINQYKWSADKIGRTVYAVRCLKRQRIFMHRQILGLNKGDQILVDHMDRNGLNNQRCNLRICTRAQNNINADVFKTNKSGYRGVYFRKDIGKFRARIIVNDKGIHLGHFDDPQLAGLAYQEAAKKYFA